MYTAAININSIVSNENTRSSLKVSATTLTIGMEFVASPGVNDRRNRHNGSRSSVVSNCTKSRRPVYSFLWYCTIIIPTPAISTRFWTAYVNTTKSTSLGANSPAWFFSVLSTATTVTAKHNNMVRWKCMITTICKYIEFNHNNTTYWIKSRYAPDPFAHFPYPTNWNSE